MIIVNQAKDEIINFKNMNNIYISRTGEVRACANMEDCVYVLGKYESEERAKEVLQEIIKRYSSYLKLEGGPAILQGQMDIQPNIFNIPKVFEMPKE